MSMQMSVKTNFTAGQVSSHIFGRGDLSIFENGARTLQNVIIHPTGGVSRRRGLQLLDFLPDNGRLVPFEFNSEQTYLLCFLPQKLRIYREDLLLAELDSPWAEAQIPNINWTQSADTLLVVHPDVAPRKICRYDGDLWKIEEWQYHTADGQVFCPYHNFETDGCIISPNGSSGNLNIVAWRPLFHSGYIGVRLKINGGEGVITAVADGQHATLAVTKNLKHGNAASDWEESAFSPMRGWPASVTFHQDRMVIGGSKSLPNRLWLSKSSDLFNFDIGTGLDDESIEFSILSDQVNAIRNVVSGRHLLVFTTGAEWMVTGEPLTPQSITLSRQTNVGIYSPRNVPPQNVNGATTFISQSGKQLREFLYADVEQAYQARDLTLLSGEILADPLDCDFSRDENVLYIILGDGTVSCLTTYRSEEVNAWSKLVTEGKFLSVSVVDQNVYFMVERDGKYCLEKLSDEFCTDCGFMSSSEKPQKIWEVPECFEGKEIALVADGFTVGSKLVSEGKIELNEPASLLCGGLAFEHIIEPLPFMVDSVRPFPPRALRMILGIFRILNSRSLRLNFGSGYFEVPLKRIYKDKILDTPALNYTGDVELRSLGWKKDMEMPMWSIKSAIPVPFTLLSAIVELKIKE